MSSASSSTAAGPIRRACRPGSSNTSSTPTAPSRKAATRTMVLATIAFGGLTMRAYAFAIAAKHARPHATVFAMLGDGTFGFHMAEFDTARRHRLPFVAVVGNDACWNAEHQIQLNTYGPSRAIGCELLPTRYDAAVVGLGGHGELVTREADLSAALDRALAADKPACLNVMVARVPAPTVSRKSRPGTSGH